MRPNRYGIFGYLLAGEGRERPLVACWVLLMLAAYFPRWISGAVVLNMAAALGSLAGAYGAVVAAHLWGLGVRRARER